MTSHVSLATRLRRTGCCALAALGVGLGSTASADLLEDIRAEGEFEVGTEARFPPFEFVEDGEIVGYSADIMDHVMEEMPDVELIRRDVPWQGILPGLESGRFDYIITSVTATPERFEKYHLSVPIADATMAVLKRAGDERIEAPEDIGGLVAGSQTGSAQLQALEGLADELAEDGEPVEDIRTYTDFNEAYADLANGRVDVVINSLPNLLEAARVRPDVFEVVRPTFGPKTYFTWAGRNDAESEALNAFMDEQLRRLHEDGTLAELQEKWFGDTMNLPTELPQPE